MRKLFVGLGALVVPAVFAGFVATGCDAANSVAGDVCGPCGSPITGDVSISGDARLDGFFAAVGDLGKATAKINADFDANLSDLEKIFEVDVAANADIGARVDALVAKINATVTANVDGGVKVAYAAPKCSANVSLTVEAQANCEAKAGCEVEANPGSVSVECSGSCSGACEGSCAADVKAVCEVQGPSVECTGKCEGSCTMQLAAGTACNGKCDGTCSVATDSAGNCNGECDGSCTVTGEAAANCTGTCSGSCAVEAPSGGCEAGATAKCEGKCEGKCSGGCTGEVTPPSASASCDASAKCEASASAQGSANLTCTPPSLELSYSLKASVAGNVDAKAKFAGQIDALKVKGVAILQGFAQYKLLVQGDASVGFESPVAKIQGQLTGFIDAAASGDFGFDIPKARLLCLPQAFEDSVTVMGKVATEGAANIKAQGTLAAKLTGGFGS